MTERRGDGELEADILGVLWASDDALTPADVNERLGADLAYTTVMTVLTRLWGKGLVDRTRHGRAYAYRAVVTESELATRRITETLDAASDRNAVLSRFVGSLPKRDLAALRRLLDPKGGTR